jgi:acyl dehydratase
MQGRFFEDFAVGQKFSSGTMTVSADRIKAFAREFDPQPFHVDEEAAAHSLFVDSDMKPAGGSIGAGGSDLSWPRPVRPGDVLHVEIEVTDLRPSRSRPEIGVMKVRMTTYNQAGEPVQIASPTMIVPRRPMK